MASVILPTLVHLPRARPHSRVPDAACERRATPSGGTRGIRQFRSRGRGLVSRHRWLPRPHSRVLQSACWISARRRGAPLGLGAGSSRRSRDTAEGARGPATCSLRRSTSYGLRGDVRASAHAAGGQAEKTKKTTVPVVILTLRRREPSTTVYETASARNCSACWAELAGRSRARIRYNRDGTLLAGDPAWTSARLIEAAGRRAACGARASASGHNTGMLDMYSDFTQIQARSARTSRSSRRRPSGPVERSAAYVEQMATRFARVRARCPRQRPIADSIDPATFKWRRVCGGLDASSAIRARRLTYYYRGLSDNGNERVGAGMIVGNSLLRPGVPTAGEGDSDEGGHFLLDRREGALHRVLRARFDGDSCSWPDAPTLATPTPPRAARASSSTQFGAVCRSSEGAARPRHDPLSLATADGDSQAAAPRAVDRGPTFRIGHTNRASLLAAPRNSWTPGARGPTNHFALGVGHRAGDIRASRLLCLELAWFVAALRSRRSTRAESGRACAAARLDPHRAREGKRFNRPVSLPDGLRLNLLRSPERSTGARAARRSHARRAASNGGVSTTRSPREPGRLLGLPVHYRDNVPSAFERAMRAPARSCPHAVSTMPINPCSNCSGGGEWSLAAPAHRARARSAESCRAFRNEATVDSTTGCSTRSGRWATDLSSASGCPRGSSLARDRGAGGTLLPPRVGDVRYVASGPRHASAFAAAPLRDRRPPSSR